MENGNVDLKKNLDFSQLKILPDEFDDVENWLRFPELSSSFIVTDEASPKFFSPGFNEFVAI